MRSLLATPLVWMLLPELEAADKSVRASPPVRWATRLDMAVLCCTSALVTAAGSPSIWRLSKGSPVSGIMVTVRAFWAGLVLGGGPTACTAFGISGTLGIPKFWETGGRPNCPPLPAFGTTAGVAGTAKVDCFKRVSCWLAIKAIWIAKASTVCARAAVVIFFAAAFFTGVVLAVAGGSGSSRAL